MKSMRHIGLAAVFTVGLMILFVALLPLVGGCGGDDDGGTEPSPPDGETIGPDGGTVTSDDANAAVVIPASALADEMAITVATAETPPPDYISGTAYDFGPDGTQFDQNVTLTIGYAPADLPAGTEPDSLKLCRAMGGWLPLDVFSHDAGTHTLSGEVTHFSTYGIVDFGETEPADLTAYLKDDPAAGADNEFASLVEALAWLQAGLGYEDTGTLVWQTDTVQQVEHLAFSFDLALLVDPGRTPALAGPAGSALVIDAGGAMDLGAFDITAPGGLVLNANRALSISNCDLPDDVSVSLGGVRGAPYPAGDPGATSRSPAAYRRSRGTVFANNRGMQTLGVALNAAAQHSGDLTISGNETTYLNVGGSAVLAPDVCLTVAGPASIPMPYPNIAVNAGGTSQVQVLNMTGVVKLKTRVTAGGVNPVEIREIQGTASLVDVAGTGTATVLFVDSNVDSTIIKAAAARSDITLIHDTCRANTEVQARAAQDQLQLQIDGGTYEGNVTVELPSSGQADVTLDGATHSDGRLVVSGGGKRGSRGAITLRDLTWQGSQTADHIDINGTDCGVTISGGTYTHSGSPTVILGLTEVTGAITIQEVSLTGGGVGLVDCTGSTTIDDLTVGVTSGSAYALSAGGSGGVSVQNSSLTVASSSANVLQTFEMSGSLTVSNTTLNGAQAATVASFGSTSVSLTGNPLISGRMIIADSSVQLTDNTFSGATIMDDWNSPGLQNDPVADNDGLMPTDVTTRMDWDGNGCCDYPPYLNVTDEHGNCALCDGVGGKVADWR